MIQSMTAFARSQAQGSWGSAIWEIRSVNHRYLEMSIRLPDNLHVLEANVRELIRRYLKRGKIECQLRFQAGDVQGAAIKINTHLAQELCKANDAIAKC